jgi:hypothetical protein
VFNQLQKMRFQGLATNAIRGATHAAASFLPEVCPVRGVHSKVDQFLSVIWMWWISPICGVATFNRSAWTGLSNLRTTEPHCNGHSHEGEDWQKTGDEEGRRRL